MRRALLGLTFLFVSGFTTAIALAPNRSLAAPADATTYV
jgi:hypothetical protein